jgi:hypothetical protein
MAIAVLLLSLGGTALGWYVQILKTQVAECRASVQAQERFNNLADDFADEVEKDRDAEIRNIKEGTHPCLDMSVPDLLRQNTDPLEGG